MLSRIETMVLMAMELPLPAIRRQMASAIDIIVHLGRLRDKSRKVMEIVEVTGFTDNEIVLSLLYKFEETGVSKGGRVEGRLEKKGELQQIEKLQKNGFDIYS